MTAMIPAVIINIVLNIIWIPKYGANGSALSSTISYSVAAILFLFIYSSKVGIPVREIFRYNNEDFSIVRSLLTKLKPNSIGTK